MTQGWVLKQVYQVDAQDILPKQNSVSRQGAICASHRRSCCCIAMICPVCMRVLRGLRALAALET